MKVEPEVMSCLLSMMGMFWPFRNAPSITVSCMHVLINCTTERVHCEDISAGLLNGSRNDVEESRRLSAAVNRAIKYFVQRYLLGHIVKYRLNKLA